MTRRTRNCHCNGIRLVEYDFDHSRHGNESRLSQKRFLCTEKSQAARRGQRQNNSILDVCVHKTVFRCVRFRRVFSEEFSRLSENCNNIILSRTVWLIGENVAVVFHLILRKWSSFKNIRRLCVAFFELSFEKQNAVGRFVNARFLSWTLFFSAGVFVDCL